MRADPPLPTEVEVSVFGLGVGECIVVHVGGNEWVVVDSCMAEDGERPVALAYLADLDVEPAQIRLILATHWHSDHIEGLADLVRACPQAWFGCSAALRGPELGALLLADREFFARTSALSELRDIYDAVSARETADPSLKYPHELGANQDLMISWNTALAGTLVRTLAPSPGAVTRARQSFKGLLPEAGDLRLSIGSGGPNGASLVTRIRCGKARLLLGGDLEEKGSAGTGWSAVLATPTTQADRASLFKVPHHGSDNAHHEGQWSDMLDPDPVALVTSYSAGTRPRPSRNDQDRLLQHTPNVYAAGRIPGVPEPAARTASGALGKLGMTVLTTVPGHIRARRDPATSPEWTVELNGRARQLTRRRTRRVRSNRGRRR